MPKRHSPFFFWIIGAFAIRVVSAFTHSWWNHPDEWFQTAEFARVITDGVAYHSHEMGMHLRNLAWPMALAVPLKLAEWLLPQEVSAATRAIQFFCGLLDLAGLWGFWQLVKRMRLSRTWQHLALALMILPFYTVSESIRPSSEHIAIILTWVTLGLLAAGSPLLAGLSAVAIAAVKYPAGLISLGIFMALAAETRRTKVSQTQFVKFSAGIAIGLVVFGIPDWIFYGRPWESLWMYLQFNLLTGLSASIFGQQGVQEYARIFVDHWGRMPLPFVGLPLLVAAVYGLQRAVRGRDIVFRAAAFGAIAYLIGHLLVGHKEPRFMLPLESLLLGFSIYGAAVLNWAWITSRSLKRALMATIGIGALMNTALFVKSLWGETWIAQGTYFEITRHLSENPGTCAVVTVRSPVNSFAVPVGVPIGQWALGRHELSDPSRSAMAVEWFEHDPQCSQSQTILLHLYKPDPVWPGLGCEILASGFLSVLPVSRWDWAMSKGYVSGPWYRCPSGVLRAFTKQSVIHPLTGFFPPIEKLPGFGISGEVLREMGRRRTPPLITAKAR